jgi:hypothetical protein
LASAKIARSTTPAITKKRTLEEFFFAGVVEVVTGFAATDVVFEVEVSPREGTGGITIFVASTPAGRFGSAFLIGRFAEDFFTVDFFLLATFLLAAFLLAAFLLAAFFTDDFLVAARLVATFFVADFLALFRAGRADFFLLATLAPSTLEVSSNFSCRKPTRDFHDGLAFTKIFIRAMNSRKEPP